MGRETSAALACALLLAALTLSLAACGGGSTAGPLVRSPTVTTTAAPPSSPRTTTVPDAPAATTTASTPAPPPPAAPRTRRAQPSGAAAPPPAAGEGALADAPAASSAPAAPEPAATLLDERAKLILTRRVSPAHYFQQGTVTGTYDGTMAVEARITSKGVIVKFTATLPGGTISGRGLAVAILDSTTWPGLRGRAVVTGGTGRFAQIAGRRLKVTGRAKPDASRAHVRLVGTVSGI